jgi:hypothetical protein
VPNLTAPVTSIEGTTGSNHRTLNNTTRTFTLDLTGSDAGESGLQYFEVYASVDGGPDHELGPDAIPAEPADSSGDCHSTTTVVDFGPLTATDSNGVATFPGLALNKPRNSSRQPTGQSIGIDGLNENHA